MEEENGALAMLWCGCEHGVIAVGMEASNDLRAGRFIDTEALCTDGNAAIGVHFGRGSLAPDIGPPRAGGYGSQR